MQNETEMKFAVSHLVGDEETILRLFGPEQKQQALCFARAVVKDYDRGLVCVFTAVFRAGTMERVDDGLRLYDGFRCGNS